MELPATTARVDARREGGAETVFGRDVVDCLAGVHKGVCGLEGRERACDDFVLRRCENILLHIGRNGRPDPARPPDDTYGLRHLNLGGRS
jgi:hypothetical protein